MWAFLFFSQMLQPLENRWLVLVLLSLIILLTLGCPLSTSCSSSLCCHGFAMVALRSSSVLTYIFLPLGCSHLEDEYGLTPDILFTVCSPKRVRHGQLTWLFGEWGGSCRANFFGHYDEHSTTELYPSPCALCSQCLWKWDCWGLRVNTKKEQKVYDCL